MKILTVGFILLLLIAPSFGFGKPVPKTPQMIDNFESGKISDWWTFGSVSLQLVSGKNSRYALQITGNSSDWYVGGIGFYIGKDAGKFSRLEMDVTNNNKDNGAMKLELYDDDNGNWQIEQDPKKGYAPIYDDRFSCELKIDWQGAKHVSIPLSEFVDNNPEAGDNIWNPQQKEGSGGLLQMQLIFSSAVKTGKLDITIDNIELKEPGK